MKEAYCTPILEARGNVRHRTMANANSSEVDGQGKLSHTATGKTDSSQESATE